MGRQIKTKAIVLHEMPIGDYDKRLILLTKELGKVTAFVKGARRSNNRMLAASQVFVYGEYILSEGKSSYNVYQANILESFHGLRLDMEDLAHAMYLLEFVDFVAKEEEENRVLMQWLLLSLKVIENKYINTKLVARIFELKAMSIIGFTPWLNDCIVCHKEEVTYFSPENGGVVCKDPGHMVKDLMIIHSGTLHAMRHVLSQPMKGIYAFELEDQELIGFEKVMTKFVWANLNHKFRTLEFLKEL